MKIYQEIAGVRVCVVGEGERLYYPYPPCVVSQPPPKDDTLLEVLLYTLFVMKMKMFNGVTIHMTPFLADHFLIYAFIV